MKNKKKVLHVIGSMNRGGAEQLIMNIYREIDSDIYQFDFAVQTNIPAYFDEEIITLGGRIFSQPSPSYKGIFSYIKSLIEIIQRNGPYDCIHSHIFSFSGVVMFIGRILNIPVRIAHSHTTSDNKIETSFRVLYKLLMRRLIISNATDLVGCSSEACKALFGKNIMDNGKATIIPNAIKIEKFMDIKKESNYLRKELNISDASLLVGHVGRFNSQKNHQFLIRIFNELQKLEPNSDLVLVGIGELREEIEEYVRKNGIINKVHFLGLRDDVPQIMSDLDIFLFPSLYEGLGIVLVEAQAAGTPCLISNNLPSEANLEIGLIYQLSLEDNPMIWGEKAINIINERKRVTWDTRMEALKNRGYYIESTVKLLSKLYSNEKNQY